MSKTFHDEKENISFFAGANGALQFPSAQLLAAAAAGAKKTKVKTTKVQKSATTNVRAGDWVCLVCNNSNFSFRNECNRCQMQTKKQNYIQSLLLISDGSKVEGGSPKRTALKDVTNQTASLNNRLKPYELNKAHSTPQDSKSDLTFKSQEDNEEFSKPQQYQFMPESYHGNCGFENMLLVTPPKNKDNREMVIFKEYFDSNQKVFPPYKSPQALPSISPMLRKIGQQEMAMLKEMRQLSFGDVSVEKNRPTLFDQGVRPFEQEENFENSEIQDISSFFKQSLNSNCATRDNSFFYSSNTSPELRKENNFYSRMEASECNQINGSEELFMSRNLDENQNSKPTKERKLDWHCTKCGNLNYSFRKFCNRCQVQR